MFYIEVVNRDTREVIRRSEALSLWQAEMLAASEEIGLDTDIYIVIILEDSTQEDGN